MDESLDLSQDFYSRVLMYTTKDECIIRGLEYVEN